MIVAHAKPHTRPGRAGHSLRLVGHFLPDSLPCHDPVLKPDSDGGLAVMVADPAAAPAAAIRWLPPHVGDSRIWVVVR